jgi:hypothetical protein
MVMPSKIIKPSNSLFCIGAEILKAMTISRNIVEIFKKLNISTARFLNALTFLYIIGIVIKINEDNIMMYTDKQILEQKKIILKNYAEYEPVNIDLVIEMYNECNYFFPNKISQRLEDAQRFHKEINCNYRKKLQQEIKDLQA